MVSRRRILGFAIGKMLRQDGWAEKYNPKNQFHVNQYDYSSCKEYLSALREKWQDYEDPECEFEDYVDVSKYSNYEDYAYDVDTYRTRLEWRDEDEVSAVRFDALMYGIELAHLAEKQSKRRIKDLLKKVTGLSKVSNIPAIENESEIIHAILNTNYLEYSGIDEFENIRLRLRDLIKYIPRQGLSYETNFEDDILDVQFNDSELENDDLKNYKSKIEYYIRQHQKDDPVILKIKENKPLSSSDLVSLENILWKELGSKKDYYSEVGEKPICEFVREIVGLDMNAAKDA